MSMHIFIRDSLYLDYHFWKESKWNFYRKLEFLYKKYKEIFLLTVGLKKFKLGENFLSLFGEKIYYDCLYGIAGYQSMLARHQRMLNSSGIKKLKTVIDVGANVGFFSKMIRERFPMARIYAIEPIPQIFSCLEKNLRGSKSKVFNLAISDKAGKVSISFNELESAKSHIVDKENVSEEGSEVLLVNAKTLDQFCEENSISSIDLLKVDTESFEHLVLKGGKKSLARTKYLHVEISVENNNNYSFTQLNSLLYSKKYNFQLVNFRNYTDKGFGPIPMGDFFYENILLN